MTLAGLVKHLALVEDHYFTHQLLGREYLSIPQNRGGMDYEE